MYTIIEVAKLAGVSVGTVSNVINKKPNVSEKNIAKVNEAIKKLNFKPSKLARGLKSGKKNTIALLIPKIATPFYASIIEGVEDAAREYGYDLMLYKTERMPDIEREYLSLLDRNGKVDGILLTSLILEESTISEIMRKKYPVVFLETAPGSTGICSVQIDNKQSMEKAVEYIIKLGHKKIAFINGNNYTYPAIQRWEGFKTVLTKYNYEIDENLCYWGEFDTITGFEGIKQILAYDTPTAVVCATDTIAQGVYNGLSTLGYSVPNDVSVIGFDDIPIANMLLPKLTTIKQPIFELGYKAVEKLIRTIESQEVQENLILETKLIVRESVKKL